MHIENQYFYLHIHISCVGTIGSHWQAKRRSLKVSVKENEVPTEKNSNRASIFATKASYISN